MEITAAMVKELRQKTGAGVMDCKNALSETDGNTEDAIRWLREKGIKASERRADRTASEGVVASYIHAGNKVGVLLELNCESDFVARNEEFQRLAKDIAMQVAATNPRYINKEDVPEEVIEREKSILRNQAINEGKPEKIVEKIVEGRLSRFYSENCLIEQPFIRDDHQTVGQLVKEKIAKFGENIVVRRFTRYRLGQET
ncbi:TPA: translation elongation factor Ts [Candidatus Poribacteria bacterium]|nr:translation elongation factor Ts [Candidatus Poribacteria bacterium]